MFKNIFDNFLNYFSRNIPKNNNSLRMNNIDLSNPIIKIIDHTGAHDRKQDPLNYFRKDVFEST